MPPIMRIRRILPALAAVMCMCSLAHAASAVGLAPASPAATREAHEHRVQSLQHSSAHLQQPDPTATAGVSAKSAPGKQEALRSVPRPFVVSNAVVRGPVPDQLAQGLQAELEDPQQSPQRRGAAGAFRALLHGAKRPKWYPRCGSCRMVRCNGGRTYCSGHCRQKRKLFFCDSTSVATPMCFRVDDAEDVDLSDRPLELLNEYDTVIVTAEAPYIGCANIANKPTGCPARGTPVDSPDHGSGVVIRSECKAEPYEPQCFSPLYPFGACECIYFIRVPVNRGSRASLRRIVRGPCKTTDLAAGSGVGGADGSPSDEGIVVLPDDDGTQTWFANFTDLGREPDYSYNQTATVGSIDIDVELDIFPGLVEYRDYFARELRDGVEFSDDYDYEADGEAVAQDYDPTPVERDIPYQYDDE